MIQAAIQGARQQRAHRQLAREPRLPAGPRARRADAARAARGDRRPGAGAAAAVGGPADAGVPADPRPGEVGARGVHRRLEGALRARLARADDALPPREAGDRRRRDRVRRRHGLHRAGGRPARQRRAPAGPPARLARRRGPAARPDRRRRRRALPASGGARWPARSCPSRRRREPAGTTDVQLLRTVPDKTYDFAPRGEFTILDAYLRALRSARRLVYLENQFLWSPEIAEVLIDKLCDPPDPRFRVVLVLPRKPTNGADTTRGQLGRMLAADAVDPTGQRLLLATTISAHSEDPEADRAGLRAREGRHRRRRVDDDRLGEPQRALAVQRHRGQRGHRRPGADPRRPGCGCGPSTCSADAARSTATRPRSWTRSGGRSPRSRPTGRLAGQPANPPARDAARRLPAGRPATGPAAGPAGGRLASRAWPAPRGVAGGVAGWLGVVGLQDRVGQAVDPLGVVAHRVAGERRADVHEAEAVRGGAAADRGRQQVGGRVQRGLLRGADPRQRVALLAVEQPRVADAATRASGAREWIWLYRLSSAPGSVLRM